MKSPVATLKQRVGETDKNVHEEIWKLIATTLKQGLRQLLENLRENVLEGEITAELTTRRYEGSPRRLAYWGGHYLRNLVTRYGLLEGLRALRRAKETLDFQLFGKYKERGSENHPQAG